MLFTLDIIRKSFLIAGLSLIGASYITAHEPIPMQFSIPECKIVSNIPTKDRDFAFIVPGDLSTYIYNNEESYYKDYQHAFFAVTKMKLGWDCMRHYEILANGCIPYFVDIDKCPEKDMIFLPKELIKEAMNLDGVSYLAIDHTKFDRKKYNVILTKILKHTRKHLTSRAMAQYFLKQINYHGTGNILFLSGSVYPDYVRDLTLIGLKELLGNRIVDVPKIPHLYKNYKLDTQLLYGKGMSYSKILDDIKIDRENIEARIQHKDFDVIIYGSLHRGLPFHDIVYKTYNTEKIVYICGEDTHECPDKHNLKNLFFREFDDTKERYSYSWFGS